MRGILLCAGRGTRLKPITDKVPKCMVLVNWKPIVEYLMENLTPFVDEFILVVKYKLEAVKEYFGDEFHGIPIRYHMQGNIYGTAGALLGIDTNEKIFIGYADTILEKKDIEQLATFSGYGCLVQTTDTPEKYGIYSINSKQNIQKVVEKPKEYIGNLAGIGFYTFPWNILKDIPKLELSPRGELELTDLINIFVKSNELRALPLLKKHMDISYPEDMKTAENYLNNR